MNFRHGCVHSEKFAYARNNSQQWLHMKQPQLNERVCKRFFKKKWTHYPDDKKYYLQAKQAEKAFQVKLYFFIYKIAPKRKQ